MMILKINLHRLLTTLMTLSPHTRPDVGHSAKKDPQTSASPLEYNQKQISYLTNHLNIMKNRKKKKVYVSLKKVLGGQQWRVTSTSTAKNSQRLKLFWRRNDSLDLPVWQNARS